MPKTTNEITEEQARGVSAFLQHITEEIAHDDEQEGIAVCPTHTIIAIGRTLGNLSVSVTDEADLNAYLRGVVDFYNYMMRKAGAHFDLVVNSDMLRELGIDPAASAPEGV